MQIARPVPGDLLCRRRLASVCVSAREQFKDALTALARAIETQIRNTMSVFTRRAERGASSRQERQVQAAPSKTRKRRGRRARQIARRQGLRQAATARPSRFTSFAQKTAHLAGKPITFLLAAATIVVWAVTGPLFGYSDTWQLVINTGTTIVTFLMVFLIQNSQNRDSLAFQVKLDELIIKLQGAGNEIAGAEDLCDEDLEALHETYRKRAAQAHDTLEKRRAVR